MGEWIFIKGEWVIVSEEGVSIKRVEGRCFDATVQQF